MKKTIIMTKCKLCGETNFVTVYQQDLEDYKQGKSVLEAFPYLTPDERELIISGTCKTCWDKEFGEE